MNETVPVEVWVLVDENGDYAVGKDAGAAAEAYAADVGQLEEVSTRRIKVTLNVPLPKPVELVAAVAAEPAVGELAAV